MMRLTDSGKKLFLAFTTVMLAIIIFGAICCIPLTIIGLIIYAIFISGNLILDKVVSNIIEKNNKRTESFAKNNNQKVKYISIKEYNDVMTKKGGGIELEDKVYVTKKEIKKL